MILNSTMIVQKKSDNTIISQARVLAFETHLIVRKLNNNITPISILKQTSSGLLNTLPSLPTNPPTVIT